MEFLDHLSQSAFAQPHTDALKNTKGDLQGWMDHEFAAVFERMLKKTFDTNQRQLTIIEVGTWKGLSAITMANIAKSLNIPVRILCIDTWLGAPEFWTWGLHDPTRGKSLKTLNGYPSIYYTFLRNVIDHGHQEVICPFPVSSNEAIEVLKFYKIMGDIIYVDAAHEYKSVSNDMERCWEILQDDGYMIGDDYHENWRGVIQAVEEFSTQKNIQKQLDGVVWSFHKKSGSL
jgi:hypothetical protein